MSDFSSAIGELDRDIAKQTALRDALKAVQDSGGLDRAQAESKQRLDVSRREEETVKEETKAARAELARIKKNVEAANQKASQITENANAEAAKIVNDAQEQVKAERASWTEKIKDLEHRVGTLEGDMANKRVILDELERRIAEAKVKVKQILEGA